MLWVTAGESMSVLQTLQYGDLATLSDALHVGQTSKLNAGCGEGVGYVRSSQTRTTFVRVEARLLVWCTAVLMAENTGKRRQ